MGEGGLCVPEIETCTGVTVRPVSICVLEQSSCYSIVSKVWDSPFNL